MAPSNIEEDVSYNKRRLPKHALGMHAFTIFQENRSQIFLERNIEKAKEHHRERCQAQKTRNGQKSDNAKSVADLNKSFSHQATYSSVSASGGLRAKVPASNENSPGEKLERDHDTSIPAEEAVSRRTLLVKDKNKQIRRISARQLAKQDHDLNAVLKITLCNMRKKLNFKDHVSDGPRPSKRARPDTICCNVHLTIWDNSHSGQSNADPLYVQSRVCEIMKDDREDVGPGRYLELRLDRPFNIARRDIEVSFEENGKLKSRLATSYFLEFKFVPMREHSDWPPFKVLGKSDGDRQAKLDDLTKMKLQDSLIARQHGLIPEPGKALTLFFFSEGVTWRTKYGLDMKAEWISPETASKDIEMQKDNVESWMLDENNRAFGREVKRTQAESRAARKSAADINPITSPAISQPHRIRWVYDFRKPLPDGAKKKFREFYTIGLECYACSKTFQTLEDLLFHMERMHALFHYEFERYEEIGGIMTGSVIHISEPLLPELRVRNAEDFFRDKQFYWQAPRKALDISQHTLNNNKSWLGAQPQQRSKKNTAGQRKKVGVEDPKTALRSAEGFLPFEFVPPFRPEGRRRKRQINLPLITKNPLQAAAYTSISHRPLLANNADDQMSESDDEADDTFLVDRWLQELDLYAREQSWSDAKRRLYKRWGYHVFYREQTPHARFIGDTLIRFVRQERQWLLRRGARWERFPNRDELQLESIGAMQELMLELVARKIINQQVCNDVIVMLESPDAEIDLPMEEKIELQQDHAALYPSRVANEEERLVQRLRVTQSTKPVDSCASCREPLGHDNHRALRCSNIACKQSGNWYHAKCVGFELVDQHRGPVVGRSASVPSLTKDFMMRRQNWRCLLCRDS